MSRRKKIALVLILACAIAAGGVAVMTVYRLLSPQVSPEGHRPISSLWRGVSVAVQLVPAPTSPRIPKRAVEVSIVDV